MRKLLLFLVILFIVPVDVYALEYAVKLSGKDIIQTYDSFGDGNRSMFIDIDSYQEIVSARVYIKYDRDVISPALCGKRGFRAEGCWVSSDENRTVIFDYRRIDDLEGEHLYYVVFKALENVPEGKTTTVEVWVENAKDKDGNDVVVSSSSKTYTLKYVWPKYNQDSSSSESVDNVNDTSVSDEVNSVTSNNNVDSKNSSSSDVNNSSIPSSNSNNNNSYDNENVDINSVTDNKSNNINKSDNNNMDVNDEDSVIVFDKVEEENETVNIDDSNESNLEVEEKLEDKEEEKKIIDEKYFIIGGVVLGIVIITGLFTWYKRYKEEQKFFEQI